MGKLLALELFNFKSYKGHHVLRFGDSYFTSIIGPNGSGKSNSMDAISFVLGIKSSHLRSAHLKDLVYRGRVLKHSKIDANGDVIEEGEEAADGNAEAGAEEDDADTQTSTQRNDPQTAWVMAVYEDDAGEEQRWKRSITSAGSSEYRINNRTVTAKQYNEALEAENILIKARNFLVFQGDVEAIASQNAKDLTRLIEQISGSLEYKADYDRLREEKEKADEEQANKLTQRRGINGEIRQYQLQKEELDRYENMREEKDQATATHYLWKLFHFQQTIDDSTAEIQKHQEELQDFRRNVEKYQKSLEDAKREQAKVGRDVGKLERQIKQKEKSVEEKENALVPIDEKLSISNANLKKYQSRISEITKERDSQQKAADSLQKGLSTVQKAQTKWESEWAEQQRQAGRELSEQDLREYQRLRGEVYKRSGNDQIKIDNLSRQVKTDEETVNSLKSKVDSTEVHISGLEGEVSGLDERRSDIQSAIKNTEKEVSEKKKTINTLSSERIRTAQKHTELEEKLQEVLKKLYDAQQQQRETQKETQQRETVAALKRIFPGVRGMVNTLCKPKQKKYEQAMSTVLGRHWDAVVVDTESTAKEAIKYLKEQRAGLITFLPLDSIIHTQPNANLRGLHRGMRLAVDTIEFDSSVERAIGYACGNSIVCDDLAIAKEMCYGRKVDAKAVTLDGTVIHKGGNMTGGEGPGDKKRRFEDSELENLRQLKDKFIGDISALPRGHRRQAEEEQLQGELIGLESRLQYMRDEVKALDRNIESKTKELDFAKSTLDDVRPKYDEQAAGLESLREQLEGHRESIAGVEDTVFSAFCQRLGYNSIQDYEDQQGTLQQEAEQKKVEFKRQVTRLENQISFEQQRLQSTKDRIKAIEASSQRDADLVAQLEGERQELGDAIDEINAQIEELNDQLAQLRETFDERGNTVNEARREMQKRSKSVEKTLKEVSALEADVQKASAGRYTALRSCKVENIELPLERGSRKIDSLPLEDALLEQDEDQTMMDIDGQEISTRAPTVNDYGIAINFSDLADDLQEDGSDEMDAQLAEKISSFQTSLEKMAPNMRSADRLEETSEKLQDTERAFNDSRSAAKKATKAFETVKQKRMDAFNTAFTHISQHLSPIYRDLTRSTSFPLGGQAYLDAEELDEPYLHGIKYAAMPPLKRFRDMEHLSGGEKTMAALALLFAIHSFAPSPFFVLDEVDAALDNVNTGRLMAYVKEHCGPGMQFVVISLKSGFFEGSETLVGVLRDQSANSSRALTLDVSTTISLHFSMTPMLTLLTLVAEISSSLKLKCRKWHTREMRMAVAQGGCV